MNTFGQKFRLTTYGESHGLAVGGIIDGCPPRMAIDFEAVDADLSRRSSGAPRQEEDQIEWLSGIRDGISLGTPIAFSIHNHNARPDDYAPLEHLFRPGHADYTYQARYGVRDHRGGGRASARETVARVVAGAIAKQVITPVSIHAEVDSLGPEGDTRGGIVSCRIEGLKAGVGNPIFGKLSALLAQAMMSIPSAIGFEMGAGFAAAEMKGSEYVDRWNADGTTQTNHCGGVQGGISNGMPVEFRVAFHPVVTLPSEVECLSDEGTLVPTTIGGRHDNCQVMRAPVIVEAMAALTLADLLV
ncbi:MAG: chorismate synthase [Bacteroidales bacterium]|nr:chorismate synthase [Bacteroidales bacterium]